MAETLESMLYPTKGKRCASCGVYAEETVTFEHSDWFGTSQQAWCGRCVKLLTRPPKALDPRSQIP